MEPVSVPQVMKNPSLGKVGIEQSPVTNVNIDNPKIKWTNMIQCTRIESVDWKY